MNKIISVFLLFVMGTAIGCAFSRRDVLSTKDEPDIKFGLMERDRPGYYYVYKETTTIPLILSDPDFRFGFSVEHRRAGEHVGHVVLHRPAEPKKVTFTFNRDMTPLGHSLQDSGRTVETDDVSYKEIWGMDLALQEDDPLGQYVVEVYIDGRLVRSISFQVIPP